MNCPLKYVGQTEHSISDIRSTYITLEVTAVTPDTQTTY
jgi:hypothetical protein